MLAVPVPRSEDAGFTVLLVCTGNICRSALAERVGRAYLHQVLGNDADRVSIVSAGTQAVVSSGMHPDTALVLGGFGADAGDFRFAQTRRCRMRVLEYDLAWGAADAGTG